MIVRGSRDVERCLLHMQLALTVSSTELRLVGSGDVSGKMLFLRLPAKLLAPLAPGCKTDALLLFSAAALAKGVGPPTLCHATDDSQC